MHRFFQYIHFFVGWPDFNSTSVTQFTAQQILCKAIILVLVYGRNTKPVPFLPHDNFFQSFLCFSIWFPDSTSNCVKSIPIMWVGNFTSFLKGGMGGKNVAMTTPLLVTHAAGMGIRVGNKYLVNCQNRLSLSAWLLCSGKMKDKVLCKIQRIHTFSGFLFVFFFFLEMGRSNDYSLPYCIEL